MKLSKFTAVSVILISILTSCLKPQDIECGMVTVCVINHEQDQAVVYRWLHQTEYDTLLPGHCASITLTDVTLETDKLGEVDTATAPKVTFITPDQAHVYAITGCDMEFTATSGFIGYSENCDNGKYNPETGETDIDCGGFCKPCGPPNLPCVLNEDYLQWNIGGLLGGDLTSTHVDQYSDIELDFNFNYATLRAYINISELPEETTRYNIGQSDNEVHLLYTTPASFTNFYCNQSEGYLYLIKDSNGEFSLQFCDLNFTDGNYDFVGSANLSLIL